MYKANTINLIKILSSMIFLFILVPGQVLGQTSTNSDCLSGPRQYNTLRNSSSMPAVTPGVPGTPDLVNGALYTLPGSPSGQGQPPAVGSGPVPSPVIPGDIGAPLPVPSGAVNNTSKVPINGSIFSDTQSTPPPKDPTKIYVPGAGYYETLGGQQQGVFDNGQQGYTSQPTGQRQPGTPYEAGQGYTNNPGARGNAQNWSGKQVINGPIPTGPRSGAKPKQDPLGPHDNPLGTYTNNPRIYNLQGPSPAAQPNSYQFQGPLPTVRIFSKYLVILGVVVATIFMAQAGWAMTCGVPHAGSRAIGAAGGLLLLLAGYTIWKVVQINTMHLAPYEESWKIPSTNPAPVRAKGLNPPIAPYRASNAGG